VYNSLLLKYIHKVMQFSSQSNSRAPSQKEIHTH
jgi:hypothetical protein